MNKLSKNARLYPKISSSKWNSQAKNRGGSQPVHVRPMQESPRAQQQTKPKGSKTCMHRRSKETKSHSHFSSRNPPDGVEEDNKKSREEGREGGRRRRDGEARINRRYWNQERLPPSPTWAKESYWLPQPTTPVTTLQCRAQLFTPQMDSFSHPSFHLPYLGLVLV